MILTALLVAQYAGTLELVDRTDLRVRSTLQTTVPQAAIPAMAATGTTPATPATAAMPASTTTQSGLDLVTAPGAFLRLHDHRWDYSLTYAPTLVIPNIVAVESVGAVPGASPVFMNAGGAAIGWHDREVHVTLTETGSYGQLNSAFLNPVAAVPGQPVVSQTVPAATTISVVSSRTDGSVVVAPDGRTNVMFSAGYLLAGGVTPSSREVLPEQYGPRASASFNYAVSRQDQLTTTASGIATEFTAGPCPPAIPGQPPPPASCSPEARLLIVQETLRHTLSRSASLTLSGGVAESAFRSNHGDSFQTATLPVGQAALAYQFGSHGTSQLVATALLLPTVDPRTGLVTNRLQATVTLIRPVTTLLTIRMSGNASQSVPTDAPFAATLAGGDVRSDFRLDPHLTLSVGDTAYWQDQIGYGTLLSTFAYLTLTVRTTELQF